MNAAGNYFMQLGIGKETAAQMSGLFRLQAYDKGDYFLKEGMISRFIGFIGQGAVQYFYNKDGREITFYITGNGGFTISLASFLKGVPARENIRFISDSEVWLLSHENFETLKKDPDFSKFYAQLLETQLICVDNSRFDLLTLNAAERYQKILSGEPELIQQIPLKFLSQMLGVSPRHLSRIRKQLIGQSAAVRP